MICKTIETATAVETLAGVKARLDQHVADYAEKVAAIRRDPDISESLRARRLEAARAAAAEQLAATEEQGRDALGVLDTQGHLLVKRDRDEELLYEIREQRAAARVQRQMDAGTSPHALIRAAELAGDEMTLAALRAELPSTPNSALLPRVDVALARLAGEQGARATARVVHGPLAERFDAQLGVARAALVSDSRAGGLNAAVALRFAEQRAEAALTDVSTLAEDVSEPVLSES
ncbi:MAG: hypothetical protein ACT4O0_01530 [Pseudonocardia sp.]